MLCLRANLPALLNGYNQFRMLLPGYMLVRQNFLMFLPSCVMNSTGCASLNVLITSCAYQFIIVYMAMPLLIYLSTVCGFKIAIPAYLVIVLRRKEIFTRTRTKTYGPRSFRVSGPSAWNKLPVFLKQCSSLAVFKSHLKTHFFNASYAMA